MLFHLSLHGQNLGFNWSSILCLPCYSLWQNLFGCVKMEEDGMESIQI